ncbi:hypothetical protein ACFL2A_04045 [Thermodesulfobacteriota bacterium]
MTKTETLRELEEIAKKLSYEISYEALKKTAPYVKSGLVKLEERKMILIEKGLNTDRKIAVILNVIQDEKLDGVFVKPYIKQVIASYKNR